ncbi:hypothetical protein GCM10008905_29620 [Clostridium malenominatum]|uniref:Uncharacterized protein n=1 Tax=Clostridium malenominatum TaxID=1539 RepID=A0ABN1J5L8_9CLOT
MFKNSIVEGRKLKPIKRTKIRMFLGKCYYKITRYAQWFFSGKKYSKSVEKELYYNIYFTHKTPLLRNLKNIDMWMQHNKITNLKIAIKSLNKIIIKPGETFSYWRLIGNPTRRKGYVEGTLYKSRILGRVHKT